MMIDVIGSLGMQLHHCLVVIPENFLEQTHLVPCRNALGQLAVVFFVADAGGNVIPWHFLAAGGGNYQRPSVFADGNDEKTGHSSGVLGFELRMLAIAEVIDVSGVSFHV